MISSAELIAVWFALTRAFLSVGQKIVAPQCGSTAVSVVNSLSVLPIVLLGRIRSQLRRVATVHRAGRFCPPRSSSQSPFQFVHRFTSIKRRNPSSDNSQAAWNAFAIDTCRSPIRSFFFSFTVSGISSRLAITLSNSGAIALGMM
jgi:hypothetical protein